jgi:hypothetical protein
MIDLSKGPFVFQEKSLEALCDRLRAEIPGHPEVTFKDKKPPEIRVRCGLWRGASLVIDDSDQQMKLTWIGYLIPSFMAKVMIFIVSVVVFSIIMMIVLAIVVGEFVPGVFGIGGVAGVAMYSLVERVFIASIRSSWSPELHQAIEKLKA